jgi:zinc-ribbon domain
MQCPQCNAQMEDGATFCGNCGKQIASLNAPGATIAETMAPTEISRGNQPWSAYGAQRSSLQSPPAEPQPYPATPVTPGAGQPPSRPPRNNIGRIVLFILLAIAIGTVGLVALLGKPPPHPGPTPHTPSVPATNGTVSFLDSSSIQGHTDALKTSTTGLSTPSAGTEYDGWLVNTQTEQTIALGTLVANGQTFTVNYPGDGKGTNLIGAGDKVEITQEQGKVPVPSGKVILSATFPSQAFVHIRHLLFRFPSTPGNKGLLVGLLDQAQTLNGEALALKSNADHGQLNSLKCVAQNIVNITEGSHGPHFQQLDPICLVLNINPAGDGFGLLGKNGYIATSRQHASLAATQTDSTNTIKVHARHVIIAMDNLNGWVPTIEQDALSLLTNPTDNAKVAEIVKLANQALIGVDINGDESIDPVPGEAGAQTGYNHGQLMATLSLNPA